MAHLSVGRFADVIGLSYRCGDVAGVTDGEGQFQYYSNPSSPVTFSVGSVAIGTAMGSKLLSLIDLFDKDTAVNDVRALNRGRLLYSLTSALGFESPIVIDDQIRAVVDRFKSELDLDAADPIHLDGVLRAIGNEIRKPIKSVSHVRNHLRRAASGFKVLRDIKIPVRAGSFVLGDVYLPLDDQQRYPVLVSSTIYGKRIIFSGPDVTDPEDVAAFEKAEDTWFSTTDDVPLHVPNTGPWFGNWTTQRTYETIGTFNTFVWVPQGYAMIKIDPRGVSQTPGTRGVPGQETSDYFDAVEWASAQPWSNGNVALAGNSYGANSQWDVAVMKPKGLKAMIPYAGDVDKYRDVVYQGGIPVFNYLDQWFGGVRAASPKYQDTGNVIDAMRAMPFYSSFWKATEPKLQEISVPIFMSSSQMLVVHNRGSFEAWRALPSVEKHLQVVDGNYYGWPNHQVAHLLLAFADRHLKGLEVPRVEPVGLQMRTGGGEWTWRTESDWPVSGTTYQRWHLHPDGSMALERPTGPERIFRYSADPEPKSLSAGASFTSDSLRDDMELAGHFTATVNISSSSSDADVVVSIWAIDQMGNPIRFCVQPTLQPLAMGMLRASHRKMDPSKSLPWRPWHTHSTEDYAPLQPDEVVELNIEIPPATAVLQKGWRLRVDITPSEEQPNIPGFESTKLRNFGGDFSSGAENRLHVGEDRVSVVIIPVVPASQRRQRL